MNYKTSEKSGVFCLLMQKSSNLNELICNLGKVIKVYNYTIYFVYKNLNNESCI